MSALSASIVIPCYNKVATLSEVLVALRRQTYAHDLFEVLIVDDGSTDEIRDLAAREQTPRVRFEWLGPHSEVCPARVRNHGLEEARGDVVIFLDADILVGPDFVSEHVHAHASCGADAAIIGYVHAYGATASSRRPEVVRAPPLAGLCDALPQLLQADPKRWLDGRENHYRIWPDLARCPMPWFYYWTGNISVGRLLAREVGGFDESFKNWGFEDIEFGYRLWKRGLSFALRRAAWGFHYPHPTASDEQKWINLRQFLAKHSEPYPELGCFSIAHFHQPHAARVRWEVLDRLAAPPRALQPTAEEFAACTTLARHGHGRPVAWFGEQPAIPHRDAKPEFVSRPFQPEREAGCAGLLGLALPHSDSAFGAAVLWDYWQHLSPAALRFCLTEVSRVADTCILGSSGPTGHADAFVATVLADHDDLTAEVVELPGGGRVHSIRRKR